MHTVKRIFVVGCVLLCAGLIVIIAFPSVKTPQELKNLPQLLTIEVGKVLTDVASRISLPGPLTLRHPEKPLSVRGVVEDTNNERTARGLPVLRENALLTEMANRKLTDMFTKQYFDHIAPDGRGPSDLADEAGYQFIVIGENLALGSFDGDADLVAAWMNSPGHRANILGASYTEIGVAVREGTYQGKKAWIAVQEFGRPQSDCPAPSQTEKQTIETLENELAELARQIAAVSHSLEYHRDRETVAEYNRLIDAYNAALAVLKTKVEVYNHAIREFNQCVSG